MSDHEMMTNEQELFDQEALGQAERYRRRKITSVLAIAFADIAQSTELCERLGEIEYERAREAHSVDVREIVETDDAGVVIKSTGDGFLMAFSEPSTAVERLVDLQSRISSVPTLLE